MDNEIIVKPDQPLAAMEQGAMSLTQATQRWQQFRAFVGSQLREGVDFGKVGPGDKKRKPGLFRPGAEKILKFYGMGARISHTPETIIDFNKPFFHYACEAVVFRVSTKEEVATAQGSANSLEDKFRWQWVAKNKIPRGLKVEDLESEERTYEGRSYLVFRIPVNDPFAQVNNIDKRAGKRALVAATLIACAASDFFSQDEDGEEGPEEPQEPRQGPSKAQTPTQGAKPAQEPSRGLPEPISEGKLKRLYAIAAEQKIAPDALKESLGSKFPYLKDEEGVVHISRLGWKNDYDAAVKAVEGGLK